MNLSCGSLRRCLDARCLERFDRSLRRFTPSILHNYQNEVQPVSFPVWLGTRRNDRNAGFTLPHRAVFSSISRRFSAQKLLSGTVSLDAIDRQVLDPYDERMIDELIRYKELHGDCHVPAGASKFALAERQKLGVSDELAAWVGNQRRRYQALMSRKADRIPEADLIRILTLESIGFMWSEREAQWQRSFNRLEAYRAKYGTVQVDQEKDPQLWMWTDQQRKAYRREQLSETRTDLLDELGFIFDLQEAAWRQFYEKLCAFAEKHGHANAPTHGGEDESLGFWVNRQRGHYHNNELSGERIQALEAIGFSWNVHEEKWDQFYQELEAFHAKHGHTRVPVSSGRLWQWVDRQRRSFRRQANDDSDQSQETTEKIEALNKINFDWESATNDSERRAKRLLDLTFTVDVQDQRWMDNYKKLCKFKERFGHFSIPANDPEYQHLGSWVKHQRFLYKRDRLPADRIAALDDLGFAWTGQAARWEVLYEQLVRFQAEHGHTRVPTKHRELYRWVSQQRRALRDRSDKMDKTTTGSNRNARVKIDPRLMALEKILDSDE